MRTTLSDKIMNQIADLTEQYLIEKNVFYFRDGTVFSTYPEYVPVLLSAQEQANRTLLDDGVITKDMLLADAMKNGFAGNGCN